MLMFVGSDLEEEDIEILKKCLKMSKKKKKKSRKITQINGDDVHSSVVEENRTVSDQLLNSAERQKTVKRKLDDTQNEGTAHKIKRKSLNSRLERLIKIKNRRQKIPADSKLSPPCKGKEVKWSNIKTGNSQSHSNSDSNDSGIGSAGNSVENDQHLKDRHAASEKFENNVLFNKSISCSSTEETISCLEKTQCVCDVNLHKCTCITFISGPDDAYFCDTSHCTIPAPDMIVAMDCEFVGVQPKDTSALGRCSIVDFHGKILYDRYVRPEATIMTYRTRWSGIKKSHLQKALPFSVAQKQISKIIQGKIVVGHAVFNDFKVLQIQHSGKYIRDTAAYKPLRALASLSERTPASLKKLSQILLGSTIQQKQHCSVEDSRATLDLYKLVRTSWEQKILEKEIKRTTNNNTPETDIVSSIGGENSDFTDDVKTFLSDEFWPQYLFPSDNIE